jgi:hypothetical protein
MPDHVRHDKLDTTLDKLKEEIKSLIRVGVGEEITRLNTKIDFLISDNQKLMEEVSRIKQEELEIFQRLSSLEGKFENLAQDTWLKVENEILKSNLKKYLE